MVISIYLRKLMRFSAIIREIITSNSGISSKRVSGLLLIIVSIVLSFIAMFVTVPKMTVDDSILILIAQFLTIGAGLLGLTLKENKSFSEPPIVRRDRGKEKPKYTRNNNESEEICNG